MGTNELEGQNGLNGNQQAPVNPNKGYKIIIIALAVIVVVVSGLFLSNINDLKDANLILNEEKVALTEDLELAVVDLNGIKTENDSINQSLTVQKLKADSLLKALSKEKNFSRAKIKKYTKELGTLRTIMKRYIGQIDSLNTVNKVLSNQNVKYRAELKVTSLRADAAEEQSQELTAKIRKGAKVNARDIEMILSRKPNGSATRAKRATSMKVDFIVSANPIALPGERAIYCRVITPEGYPLAESPTSLFDFEGDKLTYTAARDIDYQNEDLKISLFYDCVDLKDGKYIIEVYMDSVLIGSATATTK